ncbi:MAG: hypothetical protein VKI83_02990 [Synechococcaceae cyanobacterium]|nr:hypothetical protein [Synechococcaceae cyanobacterium]
MTTSRGDGFAVLPVARGYVLKTRLSWRRAQRVLRRPGLEWQAHQLMGLWRGQPPSPTILDPRVGYASFGSSLLQHQSGTIRLLAESAERWSRLDDPLRRQSTGYPINLLLPDDLRRDPRILELALDERLLRPAAEYLGQIPRLCNLRLWWSPATDSLDGSRQFHYDHRDRRQVKVFVNLVDVDSETGPLRFMPADSCRRFNARRGYRFGRYTDQEVFDACAPSELRDSCGPIGSGVMVDTARCMHYGSRWNTRPRFLLAVSFVRANSAQPNQCATLDSVRDELAARVYADDPLRRFVLQAPA